MLTNLIILLFILINFDCLGQSKETDFNAEENPQLEVVIDQYIEPFHFEIYSSEFKDIESIEKFCKAFIQWKVKKILLTGHCTLQEFEINPNISIDRVEQIKNLMIDYGIDADSIEIQDYSYEQPLDPSGNDKINPIARICNPCLLCFSSTSQPQ